MENNRMNWKAEMIWAQSRSKRNNLTSPQNIAKNIGFDSIFHQFHIDRSSAAERKQNSASYGMCFIIFYTQIQLNRIYI